MNRHLDCNDIAWLTLNLFYSQILLLPLYSSTLFILQYYPNYVAPSETTPRDLNAAAELRKKILVTEILDKTMHISPQDISESNRTLLVCTDDRISYYAMQGGRISLDLIILY